MLIYVSHTEPVTGWWLLLLLSLIRLELTKGTVRLLVQRWRVFSVTCRLRRPGGSSGFCVCKIEKGVMKTQKESVPE